ncbi:MAG: radical SAM/SPASM domain-containing protein [Eubacteriaceae bacterium]|nr:radical SAM/SPASM domain-containing protein [Eubacteriaceae bacterium]
MENQMLQDYLSDGVRDTVLGIARATLRHPGASRFIAGFARSRNQAEKTRARFERQGQHIPPFLIASITSRCNLHCAGCYARANHWCTDGGTPDELAPNHWARLFSEAKDLGVSFILLAGGEPFLRRDVLELAGRCPQILFPIFTNGTLLDDGTLGFLKNHRNLAPVVSIEGDAAFTDSRRGPGMYKKLMTTMDRLGTAGILYGASITVTRENRDAVTATPFLDALHRRGCKAIITVEYVPFCKSTAGLAPTPEDRRQLTAILDQRRKDYPDMVFIDFPGDERASGGCLAAGRGFFHINPAGNAEPCPFSPYSDTNLASHTLLDALESPLFKKLDTSGTLTQEHNGACVLFESRETVARFAKDVSGETAL